MPDDDRMKSLTSGESLQLFGIERKKSRATKREQESVNRVWEEETQETPGKKLNAEDYTPSDTEKEERETHLEIIEEIIIEKGCRDGEYSP